MDIRLHRSPVARWRAYLELFAMLAPWHREAVFLTLSDDDLARFDVRTNPSSASAERHTALASPFDQYWTSPTRLEALFRLLVPSSGARPWTEVRRVGRASLREFSDPFGSALLAIRARVLELDAAEPAVKGRRAKRDQAERVLAPYTEVAGHWLSAAVWPAGMELWGVTTILQAASGKAESARLLGQACYCWYGPAVRTGTRPKVRRLPDGPRVVDTA